MDAETGVVPSLSPTLANAHDVTEAHRLLHVEEKQVWDFAGYIGLQKRKDNLGLDVDWQVALKLGKRKLLARGRLEEWAERNKASIQAKVEHPFLEMNRRFGYFKVRYRGPAKNTERMALLLGLSILRRVRSLLAGLSRG